MKERGSSGASAAKLRRIGRGDRADEASLGEAAAAERVGDRRLDTRQLDVELDGEAEARDERERLVERRRAGGNLRPVGEHERAVRAPEHVELHRIEPVRRSGLDRGEAVLRRERRRAPVADADDVRGAAPELERHHVTRRMTTTATSSPSSPPAKLRQSSTTAAASSRGGRSRRSASSASSRSTPYSSPSRRASITPSV